jgi:hypothetical protein
MNCPSPEVKPASRKDGLVLGRTRGLISAPDIMEIDGCKVPIPRRGRSGAKRSTRVEGVGWFLNQLALSGLTV